MKKCSRCKQEKDFSNYHKSKSSKTGYQAYCKDCSSKNKSYLAEYRKNNSEKIKQSQSNWYSNNRESQLLKFKEYYQENIEYLRNKGKKHYQDNKSLYLHYSKKRKAAIKRAVPIWLTDEMESQIKEIYRIASEKTKEEGIPYHVDHIIPLCGEFVCGLHVPSNLQVLLGELNLEKSNKFNHEDLDD